MKRNSLLILLTIILVFTLVFATACDNECTHSFQGATYTVTTQATKTNVGSATVTCNDCKESVTVEIPVLTDTAVWTVDTTPATHQEKGAEVYTSVYGTVTIEIPKLTEHNFAGAYTLVTAPTVDATGTATQACVCGETQTVTVPKLTDSVWTMDSTHADYQVAVCNKNGTDVYTSVYGIVKVETTNADNHDFSADFTIDIPAECATAGSKSKHCSRCDATTEVTVIPALDHDYTDVAWTVTTQATISATGTATRDCTRDCGHVDTTTIPVLTDATVWTKSTVDATYATAGKDVYTSANFGEVEITIPRLVAPYENKTYQNVEIDIESDTTGAFEVGVPTSFYTYTSDGAVVTLDGNVGSATAYPFNGVFAFSVENDKTGAILIKKYAKDDTEMTGEFTVINAVMDWSTGIIIMPKNGSWADTIFIVPSATKINHDHLFVSSWGAGAAITYNDGTNSANFYVDANGAYAGVTFTDVAGATVNAQDAYNAQSLVIKKGNDVIAQFASKDGALVETDGLQGTYTNATMGTVVVDGVGGIKLTVGGSDFTGTYKVDGDKIGAIVDGLGYNNQGQYYDITLNSADNTFTATAKTVTITFENAPVGSPTDVEMPSAYVDASVNIAYALPTVAQSATHVFSNWADSTGKKVDDPFTATESVTLYAVWKEKVAVTIHNLVDNGSLNGSATLYLGQGARIEDALATYSYDVEEDLRKVFAGWFANADCTTELPDTIPADATTFDIYAKWDDFHPMYGTYSGGNFYSNSAGITLSSGSFSKTVTVDAKGNVSGSIGKGAITLNADGKFFYVDGSTTKVGYYDSANGIIVTKYNGGSSIVYDTDIYIRINEGETVTTVKENDSVVVDKVTKFHRWTVKDSAEQTVKTVIFVVIVEIGNEVNYANVYTFVDESVVPATMKDIAKDGTLISLVDARGNSLVLGFNGGKLVEQDGTQGTYVDSAKGDVVLNGVGGITVGTDKGSYSATDVENTYDVYMTEGENTVYYSLVINGTNCTLTKEMVNVTFTSANGLVTADGAVSSPLSANKNVEITLPTLANVDSARFAGWKLGETTYKGGATYLVKGEVEFVAIWESKVTVTIVYGNDSANGAIDSYFVNDTLDLDDHVPTGTLADGKVFSHWSYQENGTAITSWKLTQETVTVYGVWVEPHAMAGTYRGGNTFKSGTGTMSVATGGTITIDDLGNISGSGIGTGKITLNDDGTFVYGSNDYVGYFDSVNGIIVAGYNGKTSLTYDTNIYVRVADGQTLACTASTDTYCYNGQYQFIRFTIKDATSQVVKTVNFVSVLSKDKTPNNARVYAFVDENVVPTTMSSVATEGKIFKLVDAQNNSLVLVYEGGAFVEKQYDGFEGTYTDLEETGSAIEIDGFGGWKMGEVAGSYEIIDDQTLGLTTADKSVYYELVVDTTDYVYIIETPTAPVTYQTAHGETPQAGSLNIKLQHTLPVLPNTQDKIFRGWIVNGAGDAVLVLTPATTDAITLTAKWDDKVVLTIVYGNGIEQKSYEYGAGDAVNLGDYLPAGVTNGQAFKHWSTADNGADDVTLDVITASQTIYVVWQDAHAMYGTYKGFYLHSATSFTANIDFAVAVDGKTTGVKEDDNGIVYDASTGVFSVDGNYGWFDATNGVAIISNNDTDKVGTSLYVFFRDAKAVTYAESSAWYSCANWMDNNTRIVSIKVDDVAQKIFIFNNRVYLNVSYTSTDGEVALTEIKNANQLTVKDSNGNDIANFIKTSSGLLPLDGTQGTYTGSLGDIVSEGVGTATIGGVDATYTVADGKVTIITSTKMVVVTLGEGTYTVVADGYQGSYAVDGGSATVVLDGNGGAGEDATYIVDETKLTVFTADGKTTYTMDVTAKTLTTVNNPFAGHVFTGNIVDEYGYDKYIITMTFADAVEIEGTFVMDFVDYYGGSDKTYNFTGSFDSATNTLTINIDNKTLTCTVTSGKISLPDDTSTMLNYEYLSDFSDLTSSTFTL